MLHLISEHFEAAAFRFLSLGFLGVFFFSPDEKRQTIKQLQKLTRKATFSLPLPSALSLLALKRNMQQLKSP